MGGKIGKLREGGKKQCIKCKNIYPYGRKHFYWSDRIREVLRSVCIECETKRLVAWRKTTYRKPFIELKKFRCEKCGIEKIGMYSFFDIHHIVPKEFSQHKKGYNRYQEKDKDNYMLLCPNCHRLETIAEKWRQPPESKAYKALNP